MINKIEFDDLEELFEYSLSYSLENNIEHILLFIQKIDNISKLKNILKDTDIQLIATTFPMNQLFYIQDQEGEIKEHTPEIFEEQNLQLLKDLDIPLVSSGMPLDPIIIPGSSDKTYSVISQTLNLFGEGVDLAIQSAMMATDTGFLKSGDRCLSLTSKSILDLYTCNSKYLFHPNIGLKINQIIT